MIELYQVEYEIDGRRYAVNMPARSWRHAEEIASSFGGKVTGEDITQVSCIPAQQLMDFVAAVADDEIKWKHNALEQLEAFLAMGWPAQPDETTP